MPTADPQRITRLRTIIFEASHACNLDCVYCYNYWKAGGMKPSGHLSTWRTLRMLSRVIQQTRCEQIAFSGGEPLLREDIVELAAFLGIKGVRASVLTNGILLDRQMIKDLRRVGVGLFQITLLGMDEAVHDWHCGAGAFRGAVQAIETLRSEGARLSVTFILTRKNLSQIEPVVRFVASIKGRSFMFNRFNPGGEGLRHMAELMPTLGELREGLAAGSRAVARFREARPDFCRECPHWKTCLGSCAALDPFVESLLGGPV